MDLKILEHIISIYTERKFFMQNVYVVEAFANFSTCLLSVDS